MQIIWQAARLIMLMTFLTGLAYPLAVTGLVQRLFPWQADGSLLRKSDACVGSALLAQPFEQEGYFWPRPSAAGYATVPSGASQLGPTSAARLEIRRRRAERWRQTHGLPAKAEVPADLLSASGSGLDPHISPAAARFQLERISRARRFSPAQKDQAAGLIRRRTEPPQFGLLGQARVNVLLLNLALDELQ